MEMFSHDPTCRVCLEIKPETFDLMSAIPKDLKITYLYCYNFCTRLEAVKDDGYPFLICTSCAKELEDAYDFIKKCEESDRILRGKALPEQDSGIIEYTVHEMFLERESLDDEDDNSNQINQEHLQMQLNENNDEMVCTQNSFEIATEYEELIEEEVEISHYQCDECKINFLSRKDFDFHVELHEKSGKENNICNVCGKKFNTQTTLTTHMLKHDEISKPYGCRFCDKKYFSRYGLHLHTGTHHLGKTKEAKLLCPICGKGFTTKQHLTEHMIVHTGEKNYICAVCSKAFGTIFRLRSHMRTHTGEKPFTCKTCGVSFNQSNALKCHVRLHTGEKPYKCTVCEKRFTQSTILKTHMALHTGKPIQCELCDKKFTRPSYLIQHQRDHTGEKPYACTECSATYKQKSHLDRHMDTHNGVRHTCTICYRQYTKKASLKVHMYEHTGNKPFQCSHCPQAYARKDKFKQHSMREHSINIV